LRYEISVTVHDERDRVEVAMAVAMALPDNAAISIKEIPEEPDSGAPME
jgi:hypothetical protein